MHNLNHQSANDSTNLMLVNQCPKLNPTTSPCDTVNWNALHVLYEMHSMIPCVVLYSGEPIVLHAGEPMESIHWIRQCEMPDLRKTKRLDRNDVCHNIVSNNSSAMLQLDYAYLDFISADEHNLIPVTDQVNTFHNHLDNDGLFGLQLRMLPIGLAFVNDPDLMGARVHFTGLIHRSNELNHKLDESNHVLKVEGQMLHVRHVFQVRHQIITMKMIMIMVRFDGMTWQDIMDLHTKARDKRQDICIEIAILLSILYSSMWNGLNQEKSRTDWNEQQLGTTVG